MTLRRKRKNFKAKGFPLSIYFEPDVIRRLDSLASAFGESRSALVNEFVSERLAFYEEMISAIEAQEEINE